MSLCPVCGYSMEFPPTDWNICPSCGTEFGYNDVGKSHIDLRRIWIEGGMRWWSPVEKQPDEWDPETQLIVGVYLLPQEWPLQSEIRSVRRRHSYRRSRFRRRGMASTRRRIVAGAA